MRRLLGVGLVAGLILAAAPATAGAVTTSPVSAAVRAAVPAAVRAAVRAAPSAGTPEGTYVPVTPTRLYDSRTSPGRQLRAGEAATVKVTGRAGVPSTGVEAVVVNLTAVAPTRAGYLAAYPTTSSGAGVSNVSFTQGDTIAGLATVPVAADGSVRVRNTTTASGTAVHVLVDVQGYYLSATATPTTTPADFFPTYPSRVLDTRTTADGPILDPNEIVDVDLTVDDSDDTGAANDDVDAVALNLTAVSPTQPGFLVAYDGVGDPQETSNLNFRRGQTVPNNVVVPVQHLSDEEGRYISFSVGNGSSGSTHVLADVVGYYSHGESGLRFQPLSSPTRVLDTRTGVGGLSTLGAGQTGTVTPSSTAVEAGTTVELVGTLTAVVPTAATYLTAWDGTDSRPEASNLNPVRGRTVANHAYVGVSEAGTFSLYNAVGRTDALLDVTGRFDIPQSATARSGRGSALETQRRAVTERTVSRAPARTETGARQHWRG